MEYYIESQDILNSSFYIEKNTGFSSVNSKHFHSYYEIYYLSDGNIEYLVDNKKYNLNSGSLLIIPPYAIHKNVDDKATGHIRIVIYIDKNSFPELEQFKIKLFDKSDVQFYFIGGEETEHCAIRKILERLPAIKDENLRKVMLLELFLLLLQQKKISSSSVEKRMQNKQISQIIGYINTEYAGDITLESLADHFCLNSTYLSRFFKKQTGFNFSVYLNNLRISKAVNILTTTDYNITETALCVGFRSSNHFCKIFKKIMGISPLAYKKNTENR